MNFKKDCKFFQLLAAEGTGENKENMDRWGIQGENKKEKRETSKKGQQRRKINYIIWITLLRIKTFLATDLARVALVVAFGGISPSSQSKCSLRFLRVP